MTTGLLFSGSFRPTPFSLLPGLKSTIHVQVHTVHRQELVKIYRLDQSGQRNSVHTLHSFVLQWRNVLKSSRSHIPKSGLLPSFRFVVLPFSFPLRLSFSIGSCCPSCPSCPIAISVIGPAIHTDSMAVQTAKARYLLPEIEGLHHLLSPMVIP